MVEKIIIQKYFDDYSSWQYKLKEYGFKSRWKTVKKAVRQLKYSRVFDMGCGCGDYAPIFKSSDYLGMDLSCQMILRAKKLYPNYTFIQGDAENTSLPRESFDLILSVAVVEYLSDPSEHLIEICRLLRYKGYVIIAVPHKGDITKKRDTKIVKWLKLTGRPALPKDPSIIHRAFFESELTDICVDAGLTMIKTYYTNYVVIPKFIDNRLRLNWLLSKLWHPTRYARCMIIIGEKNECL